MLRCGFTVRRTLATRGVSSKVGNRLFPSLQLVFRTDEDEDRRTFATKSGGDDRKSASKNKKENFDKDVLLPAQRGELTKKHKSGIPKLAARKRHVKLEPKPARANKPDVFQGEDEEDDDNDESALDRAQAGQTGRRLSRALHQGRRADQTAKRAKEDDGSVFQDDFYAASLIDDSKYFWREEEYDIMDSAKEGPLLEEGDEDDEENVFEIPYTEHDIQETQNYFYTALDNDDIDPMMNIEIREDEEENKRVEDWQRVDPEENFFFDQNDIFNIALQDEKTFENEDLRRERIVMPLADHGTELDDFLGSMTEHPTMFAEVKYANPHAQSRREPKPDFPRNRSNPTAEFVEMYSRFLYVTNLPALEINGEEGDLENPVHRSFLQKTIAGLVGVDSSRVFPANTTSGFVGFDSPRELEDAISRGPSEPVIVSAPYIEIPMEADATHDFVKNSPKDTVVLLANLPPHISRAELAEELFPAGTELGDNYGLDLTPDDFFLLPSNKAFMRFASPEQSESALLSVLVQERLKEFGCYPVSYLRARRELIHAGFDGPANNTEVRKPGPRLVVDGDMPSKEFFLCHARLIQLRNLPPNITKQELSDLFQEKCAQPRDVQGSIEFVTCEAGHFTGKAYVGFDIFGEAEDAMPEGGCMRIKGRSVVCRLVKDRKVPHRPSPVLEKRPERSETDLLKDLDDWERFVDPADIETLEKGGVSKTVLDEALRVFRYKNATFGPLDAAMRSESLKPEKGPGEMYKELVQLYVKTLIDCLPTEDDIGDLYEALHFPDEPIDMSIIDREKERQQMLQEKRANP